MTARNVKSVFYLGKKAVKVTRSVHARSAVARAVDHLQMSDYDATMVEVYDEADGVLHAQAIYSAITKRMIVTYKRDPREGA